MGIFGGKRARAAVLPEPEEYAAPCWRAATLVLTEPSAVVADDGCASDEAYGVRFELDGNPAASLTVWTYACYANGNGDLFEPGYCTVYTVGGWAWRQYVLGPGWSPSLAGGIRAARELARALEGGVHRSGGKADDLGFDWDGNPW